MKELFTRVLARRAALRIVAPTPYTPSEVPGPVNDDEGDDLDEEEREALHRALLHAAKEAEAGRMRPAEDVLRDLRDRNRT